LDEAPGVPLDDVVEVSNYVAALDHGLERLRGGFPLSNRLIREIHGVLLSGARGSGKDPGEFRRSQNWIGGSRPGNAVFVPPPPAAVPDCMSALERFLHSEDDGLPVLVRAGLAHLQFETIHPFLDGNGRVGRKQRKDVRARRPGGSPLLGRWPSRRVPTWRPPRCPMPSCRVWEGLPRSARWLVASAPSR
jgi:Fic family protein